MSLTDFSDKYGIKRNTIQVINSTKKPDWIKKERGELYVNEGYLIEMRTAKIKMFQDAHTIYYGLTYMYGLSENRLAVYMAKKTDGDYKSWLSFIHNGMWRGFEDDNIYDYAIPKRLYWFLKFGTKLLKSMMRYRLPVERDEIDGKLTDEIERNEKYIRFNSL